MASEIDYGLLPQKAQIIFPKAFQTARARLTSGMLGMANRHQAREIMNFLTQMELYLEQASAAAGGAASDLLNQPPHGISSAVSSLLSISHTAKTNQESLKIVLSIIKGNTGPMEDATCAVEELDTDPQPAA